MTPALRVLLLEDVSTDAELIVRELGRTWSPLEVRRADTREAFTTALREFPADIILSDYSIPGFEGLDALTLARSAAPETPFIFVTGSLNEETAAECIKAGAADYVLKERLVRLAPAVTSALERRRMIAERRQLEQQLQHAQRLESVGRLAGGIAHDFNNIMTAILGYADLLLADLQPADPRRADVLEIRASAERAASLTRQLLAFSRRQILQLRPVQLNDVIREVERLLDRLLGEDIALETRLAPELPWILADAGQIEQILVNLAANARDAMPLGGRLTIETGAVTLEADEAAPASEQRPGSWVTLTVSDTGTGMDPGVRARLFEPFFTTKEVGKGTGLGLATVYGIVKQSDGMIQVGSEPGRGTTFTLLFPVTTPPETAEPRPAAPPTQVVSHSRAPAEPGQTILLAEDEETVRTLARRVLEAGGYRVLEAAGGQQALELAQARGNEIHLLLTDVIMPGMSGRELAEQLRKQLPDVPVLYMSGYTEDTVVRHGALSPGMAHLQKPFTPASLLERVRAVLSTRMHTEST